MDGEVPNNINTNGLNTFLRARYSEGCSDLEVLDLLWSSFKLPSFLFISL